MSLLRFGGQVPAFAALETGDPTEPGTELGPMASVAAADRLEEQIQAVIAVPSFSCARRGTRNTSRAIRCII